LEWRSSGHRIEVELRIIKQRKVDLVAHRLVKEELGSMAPAIAVLGLLLREAST
jgi:hypothetical protein